MAVHQTHNSLGNYSYNAFIYENCEWFVHFHKNYELIYVLDGTVELTRNGKVFPVEKGRFAMILPNELHGYRTPVASRAWVGVFSRDFVEEFARLTKGKQAVDPRFFCQEAASAYLLSGLITEEAPQLLQAKSLLYGACAAFLQTAELVDAPREQDFAWRVSRYVSEHFEEDLTFGQLAEDLGYEYHYLSRQFKRFFGMHFRQFLNLYRIDRAREQLLSSGQSIADIAYSAGFQTLRTFNRAFFKQTGMTPGEFRKTAPRLRQQRQNSDGSFYYDE